MALSVLVTGGAGFIGSHVVRELLAAGHHVTVVDNLSGGSRDVVPAGVRFILGDVVHPEVWMTEVPHVDVVVHLAAQVSVPVGESFPVRDAETNYLGTLKILETARALGVAEVRFASSAAVYGNPRRLPLEETAEIAPTSFYGISKMAAESAVLHYTDLHGMIGVVFRIANCYGPGQRAEGEGAVVAAFATSFARGQAPVIHGDGHQTRDFIFVRDVARAFATRLMDTPATLLQLSTGRATSVEFLWHLMANTAGAGSAVPRFGPQRPGDIRDSVLDPTRATQWGFSAQTRLEAGIPETYRSIVAPRG